MPGYRHVSTIVHGSATFTVGHDDGVPLTALVLVGLVLVALEPIELELIETILLSW